jgi:DNA-binding NtrC family response regulator
VKSKRVLVIDNEQSVLDSFKLLLQELGFEPVLISNYQDALGALEDAVKNKATFLAAIIDFQLNGGHTGLEVFEKMIEIDEHLARRSIVLTARHHSDILTLFSHTKVKPGLFLYKDYDDNKKIEDFLCRL